MHLCCFIMTKIVTFYALLVCKIFGPEIWLCKFFTNLMSACVYSDNWSEDETETFFATTFFQVNRPKTEDILSWGYLGGILGISWHILRISWWYFCGMLGGGRGYFPYNLLVCDLHAAYNIPKSLLEWLDWLKSD